MEFNEFLFENKAFIEGRNNPYILNKSATKTALWERSSLLSINDVIGVEMLDSKYDLSWVEPSTNYNKKQNQIDQLKCSYFKLTYVTIFAFWQMNW